MNALVKIFKNSILLYLLILFVFASYTDATDGERAKRVFLNIKSGIENNEIAEFSGYFDFRTYISLSNGTSGYYSSNQVYYILEEYFRIHQPISLDYDRLELSSESPYATGSLSYLDSGEKKKSKVFISLKAYEDNYKIAQITID